MSLVLTEKQRLGAELLSSTSLTSVLLRGGSRCVSGSTILDGHTKTIAELAEIGKPVQVITSHGIQAAEAPFLKGEAELLNFYLDDGKSIEVTDDHRFWNGDKWVRAKDLKEGDFISVSSYNEGVEHTYLQSPLPTNSEFSLLEFLLDEEYYSQILEDYRDGYSLHHHLYGQQLLEVLTFYLTYHALQCGEWGRNLSYLLFLRLGLDSHVLNQLPLFEECNQTDLKLFLRSKEDGFLGSYQLSESLSPSFLQIYELFQELLQKYLTIQKLSSLPQSFELICRNFYDLCFQFSAPCDFFDFSLSSDTPCKNGYSLVRITKITQSAKQPYYTLHVPNCQHYFANGIMHHNSGKTFLLMLAVITRAIKEPDSSHLVCRKTQQSCIDTLWYKTFEDVMKVAYPELIEHVKEYKQPRWVKIFPNGSEVIFRGLDDKDRVDKILGSEYSTIYFNEVSEISYDSVQTVLSRLAQKNGLVKKAYYDCNPTNSNHWTYKIWFDGKSPVDNKPLEDRETYAELQMNPTDNTENLDSKYLKILEGMTEAKKRRFLYGEYATDLEVAVFAEGSLKYYTKTMERGELERVVVSWDTAFKDNEYSDYSACTVWGLKDGQHFLLDMFRAKLEYPKLKKVVIEMAARWMVDEVIIEDKGSGQSLIQDLRATTDLPIIAYQPYATGKVLRAGYASQYFEGGKVFLPSGHDLLDEFIGEMLMFPHSEHDDWVDCMSQYFHWTRYDYYKEIDEREDVQYIEYVGEDYDINSVTGY